VYPTRETAPVLQVVGDFGDHDVDVAESTRSSWVLFELLLRALTGHRGRVTTTTAQPRLSHRGAGLAAVFVATMFWSFGGVFGRKSGASGLVLTFWRMWVATAIFALIAIVLRRWPSLNDLKRTALAGLFFGLNVAAFFTAIETVSVATALIIGALAPVVALPVAIMFFDETVTSTKAICAAVAVVGVIVAVIAAPSVDSTGGSAAAGYVWAIVSLLLWVAYLLLAKKIRAHVETTRFLFSVSVFGTIAVSIAVLMTGRDIGQIQGQGWWWVFGLALGPGLGGHGLVAWAQPRVDASSTAVLIQAEPVFASITAWIFLGERISFVQGVAMAVVIAALATLAWFEAKNGAIEIADVPI
jgi:drug/metabolite transporter (DMT)-like permease